LNEPSEKLPFTVLLADDEWLLCWSLERMLVRLGFQVLTAPSGQSALDLLRDRKVDWLISDLKLPDISGLDLIKRARAAQPELKAALMTAYGSADIEDQARRLGATYFAKPFKLEEVVALISSARALNR
jgi:DNA-binding NtrC family response regulator